MRKKWPSNGDQPIGHSPLNAKLAPFKACDVHWRIAKRADRWGWRINRDRTDRDRPTHHGTEVDGRGYRGGQAGSFVAGRMDYRASRRIRIVPIVSRHVHARVLEVNRVYPVSRLGLMNTQWQQQTSGTPLVLAIFTAVLSRFIISFAEFWLGWVITRVWNKYQAAIGASQVVKFYI